MPNHALLSASSSHRWLNCPPSARLCEGYDDKGSDFAAEGTDAHALCEYKLRKALGMEAKDPTEDLTWFNSEMEECANGYVSFVMELVEEAKKTCPDPVVLIEQRLDYSKYVEEGFGTGDCVIIADGTLHIVDYKHGRGVLVEADDNPQMKLYALGALELFDCIYDIDTVNMTIYQPRRSNVSTFTIPKDELYEWADQVLAPTAELAFNGDGEYHCGEWCQFCKVKSVCRALAKRCTDAASACPDPGLMSPEELAKDVLPLLATVKTWLSGVEDYALQKALEGVHFPGWKIVEGRSVRKITDGDAAAMALNEAGYRLNEIFRPRELRTITELEKLIGRKRFADICGDFIDKPQGKPTLVPESDKRPAINPAAEDFKDIDME